MVCQIMTGVELGQHYQVKSAGEKGKMWRCKLEVTVPGGVAQKRCARVTGVEGVPGLVGAHFDFAPLKLPLTAGQEEEMAVSQERGPLP